MYSKHCELVLASEQTIQQWIGGTSSVACI